MRPNLFALGAAMGQFDLVISSRAMSFFGILTPTVGRPEVTRSGTMLLFGRTIVSGPGQNFSASL